MDWVTANNYFKDGPIDTVHSLYNTPHYNIDFYILQSCYDFDYFTIYLYKGIIRK